MIPFALTLLSHTPPWVWAILALLVALGAMQLRDHVLTRQRLLVQPVALGALSLYAAVSTFGLQTGVLLAWAMGATLGAALNQPLRLPRQVQRQTDGRFAIGGSWAPMALLMTIFWLRYGINASLAMVPALAGQPAFAGIASSLYGAATGLLAARAWRVLQQGQSTAHAGSASWAAGT